jgi:hypothetical protein
MSPLAAKPVKAQTISSLAAHQNPPATGSRTKAGDSLAVDAVIIEFA